MGMDVLNKGKRMSFEQLAKSRTAIISLLCVGVLVFLYAFTILPRQLEIRETAREIAAVQNRIQIQKNFAQVYPGVVSKSRSYGKWDFPRLEKKPLNERDIGRVVPRLRDIIRESGLGAVSVQPVSESITEKGSALRVDMVLQGEWKNLHRFWKDLVRIPFWKKLESIDARSVPGGREYRLTVWFSLA
jgi:Tfp pilus assembly protein PilO